MGIFKELYGKEENKNLGSIAVIFFVSCGLSVVSYILWFLYPNMQMKVISLYPLIVGINLFIFSVTSYFFSKKKNSEKFIVLKHISFIISLGLIIIALTPFVFIKWIIYFIGKVTNKEVLFSNLPIVLVEGSLYLSLIQASINLFLEHRESVIGNSITIILTTIIISKICRFLRKKLIGATKYYEILIYSMDLGNYVRYVYIFLGILCNALSIDNNYIILIWPILLIIGVGDLLKLLEENRSSKRSILKLTRTLEEIEIIKELLYTVKECQEFNIRFKLSVDIYELDTYYLLYYDKMSKKRKKIYKNGLDSLKQLIETTYTFSRNNTKVVKELDNVLNNISKCLIN